MRIHRSHPDEQFTIIPNATLRDHRLSAVARSVLMDLLSHSEKWETNADAIWRQVQRIRGEKVGEGRRAYRAAFAELEKYGYMVRRTVRGQRGRFITELELYDTPGHKDDGTKTSAQDDAWATTDRGTSDGPPVDGTSVDGTSVDGTSVTGTSLRSTNQRSTKEEEPTKEHSTALADARAAADAARDRIEAERHRFGEAVERLPDADLRNFMLKFELRRPQIYRQCRQSAESLLKKEYPHLLKAADSAVSMDQVAYKYALLHYMPKPPEKYEWDPWVVRPLREHVQARKAA